MTADAKLTRERTLDIYSGMNEYLQNTDTTSEDGCFIKRRGFDKEEFIDGKKVDLDNHLSATLNEYLIRYAFQCRPLGRAIL
jgi:hypothetical protein